MISNHTGYYAYTIHLSIFKKTNNRSKTENATKAGYCGCWMQLRHAHVVIVFILFTLFFWGGWVNIFPMHDAWCMKHDAWCMMNDATMHNTWWMLSRLGLEMSSFQHTCACMMPRTFIHIKILFPVLTADRISGFGSVL